MTFEVPNLSANYACTYTIKTSCDALLWRLLPGKDISDKVDIAFLEYDDLAYGEAVNNKEEEKNLYAWNVGKCTNPLICSQGRLYNMLRVFSSGKSRAVSVEEILAKYGYYAHWYKQYYKHLDEIEEYNDLVEEPDLWEEFMGWEIGDKLPYPKVPPNYVGYHVSRSLDYMGGYGSISAGMYDT